MSSNGENKSSLFTPGIRILWAILAMACLIYAGMVYLVGSGTFSYVIWLVGAAFFSVCFFMAGKGRWGKVPPALRRSVYGVIGAVALVFLTCFIGMGAHFFDKGEADLDYIIVLGAQMRDSGPSVIYRYRLQKAAEYLEENPGTVCITTGAAGANESISEGCGGRDYLVSLGIPKERILVEEESGDTVQNIDNALELAGISRDNAEDLRIGIVTNGFHVFRGVHIARKLTDAKVCGIAAYMQPQYIPNNMVRECFGIIRDLLKGRLA